MWGTADSEPGETRFLSGHPTPVPPPTKALPSQASPRRTPVLAHLSCVCCLPRQSLLFSRLRPHATSLEFRLQTCIHPPARLPHGVNMASHVWGQKQNLRLPPIPPPTQQCRRSPPCPRGQTLTPAPSLSTLTCRPWAPPLLPPPSTLPGPLLTPPGALVLLAFSTLHPTVCPLTAARDASRD